METTVTVTKNAAGPRLDTSNIPQELLKIQKDSYTRTAFPIEELNRVLGGGLVAGSVVLISGDPGIGKSTLLLQISDAITRNNNGQVVYVSGEESSQQLKMRAERLGVSGGGLYIYAETNMENVMARLESMEPNLVVVDSVQTVYLEDMTGAPGSIGQIRECTLRLLRWAKKSGVPVFISGHVTKDGAIAGPKALEHIVDVVLYLEGESFNSYRILRSAKNRFGSTNEVGVFEMCGSGLVEVANPSQFFLESFVQGAIGAAVVPTLEGSRPLLVEIQALTSLAAYGPPRRISNGVDFNRLLVVAAVLSRRVGLKLGNQDIMVNVTGGLSVGEPAADLGMALAIASSYRDAEVMPFTAAVGEVGLSGELRAVTQLERRLTEAARLGFKKCIIPKVGADAINHPKDIEVIAAGTLREAVNRGLVGGKEQE